MNSLALAVLILSGLVFVEPSRKACNIFGDPNVITFDGLKFKFGGSCTHVLAMDCVDMSWIVYGEFSECGSGTYLEHITVFHNRNGAQDAILIGRGWVINHMGKKIAYKQSEGFQIGHMDVFFDGLYLTITLADEGVMLTYDGVAGLLITIDDTVNEGEMCGLCGNNDGKPDNEADQMREIGNDVKSTGLSGVEALAYQWKVDRGNYCQYPQHISHPDSRRLPCGNDYRKNEEARSACQELVDNQELFKCHSTLDLNIFYEACLVDYCYVDMLTEGYPIPCSTGSAYTKHCQSLGVPVRDEIWRREMSCPDPLSTQQAIVGEGVEQPDNGPFSVQE